MSTTHPPSAPAPPPSPSPQTTWTTTWDAYKPTVRNLIHANSTTIAATSASIIGVCFGYPFDLIKTRLQTLPYPSSVACVKEIMRNEGFRGFFTGMAPILVTVSFLRSVSFGVYNSTKGEVDGWLRRRDMGETAKLCVSSFMGGVLAGSVVTGLNAPLEFIKIQRQLEAARAFQGPGTSSSGSATMSTNSTTSATAAIHPKTPHSSPKSPLLKKQPISTSTKPPSPTSTTLQWTFRILRSHGPRGLYLGSSYHLLRDAAGTGLYFLQYETMKRLLTPPDAKSSPWTHMFSGGMAGTCSWIVLYPLDLIKSVMQREALQPLPKYKSGWEFTVHRWRKRGLGGFYRGIGAQLVRSFPVHALNFLVYEEPIRKRLPSDRIPADAKGPSHNNEVDNRRMKMTTVMMGPAPQDGPDADMEMHTIMRETSHEDASAAVEDPQRSRPTHHQQSDPGRAKPSALQPQQHTSIQMPPSPSTRIPTTSAASGYPPSAPFVDADAGVRTLDEQVTIVIQPPEPALSSATSSLPARSPTNPTTTNTLTAPSATYSLSSTSSQQQQQQPSTSSWMSGVLRPDGSSSSTPLLSPAQQALRDFTITDNSPQPPPSAPAPTSSTQQNNAGSSIYPPPTVPTRFLTAAQRRRATPILSIPIRYNKQPHFLSPTFPPELQGRIDPDVYEGRINALNEALMECTPASRKGDLRDYSYFYATLRRLGLFVLLILFTALLFAPKSQTTIYAGWGTLITVFLLMMFSAWLEKPPPAPMKMSETLDLWNLEDTDARQLFWVSRRLSENRAFTLRAVEVKWDIVVFRVEGYTNRDREGERDERGTLPLYVRDREEFWAEFPADEEAEEQPREGGEVTRIRLPSYEESRNVSRAESVVETPPGQPLEPPASSPLPETHQEPLNDISSERESTLERPRSLPPSYEIAVITPIVSPERSESPVSEEEVVIKEGNLEPATSAASTVLDPSPAAVESSNTPPSPSSTPPPNTITSYKQPATSTAEQQQVDEREP
ncbi:hypothetical protein HDV05_006684 [Chytridiales sp. JEL 0842]|nr:hypothetical protein HDV05_006684 [Chytridiales sp. JEL 0842]